MEWSECFPRDMQPGMEQISAFAGTPLWEGLCGWLEAEWSVRPLVQYSGCSGAKGWNVKYRKSGRALCTLYPGLPGGGSFTCLISSGPKEAVEAEAYLGAACGCVRDIYWAAPPLNGARWLMLEVKDEQVLRDVQALLRIRAGAR